MIIDRVLHVRSSSMDFYEATYPWSYDCDKIYGYGKELTKATLAKLYPSFAKGCYETVETSDSSEVVGTLYKSYIYTESETGGVVTKTMELGDPYTGKLFECTDGKYTEITPSPEIFDLLTTIVTRVGLVVTTKKYYVVNSSKDYRMYIGLDDPECPITESDYTAPVVIDLKKYATDHQSWRRGQLINDGDNYIISKPLVPPSRVITRDSGVLHDSSYMDYWLGYYNDHTPNIISPLKDQNTHIDTTYTTYNWWQDEVLIKNAEFASTTPISEMTSDGAVYCYIKRTTYTDTYIELKAWQISSYFTEVTRTDEYITYIPKENVKVYKKIVDSSAVVFTFDTSPVQMDQTLPIVNGFCCYPETNLQVLKACNSLPYISMPGDFHREHVLVDFSQVGGCVFRRLSTMVGDIGDFVIPSDLKYDSTKHSLLLVIDGRLMIPGEYEIFNDHIHMDKMRFTVESELDRKACSGEVASNNKRLVVADGTRDLFNAPNSFLIMVNSPNLQVIQHEPWLDVTKDMKPYGTDTYSTASKNQFDFSARGLLYDRTTRAILDYTREEHTVTFYAEKTPAKVEYKTSTVTTIHDRPLVILAHSRDNLMSAKAVFFDQPSYFAQDDQVMWPNWTILDLIFRG